jgi:hypothetical protein
MFGINNKKPATPKPTALVVEPKVAPIPEDSAQDSPIYIATAAMENKLKDDLTRRDLREKELGGLRQLPATTLPMRFYDYVESKIHSGTYENGELIEIGEVRRQLYKRVRNDSERLRQEKAVKIAQNAVIGAFNDRNFGNYTLQPAYNDDGNVIGLKIPATAEERDTYLGKIGHMRALANGKVVRAERAFMALPKDSPIRLLNATTKGTPVEIDKQLEE